MWSLAGEPLSASIAIENSAGSDSVPLRHRLLAIFIIDSSTLKSKPIERSGLVSLSQLDRDARATRLGSPCP
ncbi:unnamed protein product [Protopolystoma xenopodis]|uniref:Uncharacterized protein n=1 Tax=Protopolystoma xenopodis TaxID=117903 RepID=A0A3S5B0X7_9PLAT|nr:unnamed protein product [Protopolystoma xenopodis]